MVGEVKSLARGAAIEQSNDLARTEMGWDCIA